jgi:uncharacterized membrane protein
MAAESANSRLETFCDGVFAIALTLLILEIKTPVADGISNSDDLWHALAHLLPSLFAFLLSFAIVVISWVSHHGFMKLVNKSTPPFMYANIFLLLTIVLIPFPTALFAQFGFTDSAGPAVVIYGMVMLLTNIGWILITSTALKPHDLSRNKAAKLMVEKIRKQGISAFALYSTCTILAFWFPFVVFIILTLTWLAWLVLGLSYTVVEE